jgi:L-amino acid N-acyltransferase YncA
VPSWEAWDAAHPLRVVAERNGDIVGWAAAGPVSSRWAYRGVASRASTSRAKRKAEASVAR